MNIFQHKEACQWWDSNTQPLGYKPGALAIELNSSKAIAVKELNLSSWCIASLYIYHFSTVADFSSEKYSGSTGHRNSWNAEMFKFKKVILLKKLLKNGKKVLYQFFLKWL